MTFTAYTQFVVEGNYDGNKLSDHPGNIAF
jgi:hypothetical protein